MAPEAKIVTGDSRGVMRTMDTDSVDLIVTSPPYAEQRADHYASVAASEYVEWFDPFAREMLRIVKPHGSLVLNIKEHVSDGERNTYVLELILHLKQVVGWCWIDEYVWVKPNPWPGRWPTRFKDGWERLLHFSPTRRPKMNPTACKVPRTAATNNRIGNDGTVGRPSPGGYQPIWMPDRYPDMVLPSNVLTMSKPSTKDVRKTGHPAVFPPALPEFFIRAFTDMGDVVVDPFSGSGTTAHAAAKMARVGIGIDLAPTKYVPRPDAAVERVQSRLWPDGLPDGPDAR